MHAAETPILKIDQTQAVAHLTALGYQRRDPVYVRYIHPVTKKSIKAAKLDFAEANRYQNQGYDVYFVVNGGGDTDSAVTKCHVIFYEHDNLDKALQLALWKELRLPEPTIQIDTGGKSIHSYWVLIEPVDPTQWRELQADLLELSDGDRSLKNPSRILRLAGSYYMKGDKPGTTPAAIASNSGQCYSYEDLRAAIPQVQKPKQPTATQVRYEDITVPVPESVPLEACLSKESRQLLESGATEGGRNINGAKLARDLIGTANYLQSIGQRFNGDPWQLFLDYCHRCPSGKGWNEGEWENIWKSAESNHPSPSCKPEGVENCVRAWYWNNHIKPARRERNSDPTPTDSGNRDGSGGTPPMSAVPLRDRVLEILNRSHLAAERKEALKNLSKSSGWELREIEQLAEAIESDVGFEAETAEAKVSLPNLLRNHNQELSPANYLWGDGGRLALAMSTTAAAMPTAAAMIFSTFIAASASRIGTSSRIVIKASAKYVQPCIFWVAVIQRSGTLKTPAQRVAIDPLVNLEVEAKRACDQAMKNYEEQKKNCQEEDSPPKKPDPRKRYLTKDSTLETLERIHSDNPRGLLYYRDELAGMSKSQNAFKPSGKGADQEAELDQWNGSPLIVDRSLREICLDKTAISRTGSIQYEVMQKLAGDHEDSNGSLARWLVCAVKAPPRYLNFDDMPETGISSLLEVLYRSLEKLPGQDYLIDKDSQAIFKSWQNHLVDAEREENHPGLKLVYPKIEAYTARLALWLHCVNAILAGATPAPSIPGTTMRRAVELASFFLGQAKLVYAVNSPQSGLTGRLLKLYQFAEGKQKGITPRQVKTNLNCFKKMPTAEILRDCQSLFKDGYFRNSGETFFFGDVGDLLVVPPTSETHTKQASQRFVGDVGDVGVFEKSTNTSLPTHSNETQRQHSTEKQPPTTTNKIPETFVNTGVDAVGDIPPTTTNITNK